MGRCLHGAGEGYQIVGFDRDGYAYPPPEAECVCVDIISTASVRHGFERVRYANGERIAEACRKCEEECRKVGAE